MAKDYRNKRAPVGVYYILAVSSIVMVGGSLLGSTFAGCVNPDSRTAEELALDVCHYQRRQNPKLTCGPERVKHWAEMATCQMKLMQFEKPDDPRQKFYKENNEHRGEFIWLAGKKGSTPEEMEKKAAKYVYLSNLHGYALIFRYNLAVGMVKKMKADDTFKGLVEWSPPGKELLAEPLDCPRWVDGNCIKTWDGTTGEEDKSKGRDCLLLRSMAQAVTRANQVMFDDKKGQILPKVCFRTNLHQAVMFTTINGKGCSLEGERSGLSMPGNSHHGLGLAMDLTNEGQAEEYLIAEGIACRFIKNDKGHCSFAEENISGLKARWGQKWRNFKGKLKTLKKGWKFLRGH